MFEGKLLHRRHTEALRAFRTRWVAGALLALLFLCACGNRSRPLPPPPTTIPSSSSDSTAEAIDPTAPAPQLDVLLEPSTVQPGQSAMLSWEARNADQVVIDHNIGPVILSGRIKLFPDESATYQVTATGPGGSVSKSATVEVSGGSVFSTDGNGADLPLDQRFASFVKPVFFKFDSADLSEDAEITLEGNARWLKRPGNSEIRFVIQGHCDRRGTEEYNLALGDKRAQVVRSFLLARGIDKARMAAVSMGEERPFAGGDSDEDHALNRRAHFRLLVNEPD